MSNYVKSLYTNDMGVSSEDEHLVEGIFTDGNVDVDGHVIDPEGMRAALVDYLSWGNVRDQHGLPVGKVIELNDWNKFTVQILDENVWSKIKAGLYKGFSVGIRVLDAVVEDVNNYSADAFAGVPKAMADSIKEAGYIFRITKMLLAEVSIVDRPANPRALITAIKSTNMDNDLSYLPAIVKTIEGNKQGETKMKKTQNTEEVQTTAQEAEVTKEIETTEVVGTDIVGQLESKIASLEKDVNNLTANMDKMTNNIGTFESKLTDINESLSKMISAIEKANEPDLTVEAVAPEEISASIEVSSDGDAVVQLDMEATLKKMFTEFSESIAKSISDNVEKAIDKVKNETTEERVGGVNLGESEKTAEKKTGSQKSVSTDKSLSLQIAERIAGASKR